MTCEEFRRRNANSAFFDTLSRGERAECVKHFLGCERCRGWVEDCLLYESLGLDEKAAETIFQDMEDPEFREAVWGK